MARHSLTYEQASGKVFAYEELNADLSPSLRRLLALFTIARASTRDVMTRLLGYDSSVLFRDYSRRWWLVLSTSGLARHWDGFKERGQYEGLTAACKWLRREVTPEEWKLFKCRAGVPIGFRLWNRSETPKGAVIWTKGGCWDKKSPFTKLLVLREPLPERPLLQRYQRRLGHHRVRVLDHEVMYQVDPDKVSVPEAKRRVVEYVRRRIPEMVGYRRDRMSPAVAAWFFQTEIPAGGQRYVGPRLDWRRGSPRTYVDRTQRRQRSWNW
jgi:hypothetical protein